MLALQTFKPPGLVLTMNSSNLPVDEAAEYEDALLDAQYALKKRVEKFEDVAESVASNWERQRHFYHMAGRVRLKRRTLDRLYRQLFR